MPTYYELIQQEIDQAEINAREALEKGDMTAFNFIQFHLSNLYQALHQNGYTYLNS